MNTFFPGIKGHTLLRLYGWWTIIFLCIWASACAAPARQPAPEQMVSQVQAAAKKNKLQEQLLTQIGHATLTGYHDYQVGPEDLLEVTFFGQDDLTGDVRVNGQGKISMDMVGEVQVAGLSPREVEEKLANLYKEGRFFTNPQIKVLVKEYRYQRVVVSGAVEKPGAYEIIGPRTLLEILGQAGGLNEKAGNVIHVIRSRRVSEGSKALKVAAKEPASPGAETIVIDMRRLLMDGAMELNLPIKNGDVIFAPFAQNAYVLGAVKTPGKVPVTGKLTVAQAISMAGGLDSTLASNNITLVRFDDNGQRIDIKYNLKQVIQGEGSEALVKQDDIIFVEESGLRRALYDYKMLSPLGQFSLPVATF
jgi:polysaccharide biosynthesis/export protein